MASNNRIYDGVSPALVVPDHFFCNVSWEACGGRVWKCVCVCA